VDCNQANILHSFTECPELKVRRSNVRLRTVRNGRKPVTPSFLLTTCCCAWWPVISDACLNLATPLTSVFRSSTLRRGRVWDSCGRSCRP